MNEFLRSGNRIVTSPAGLGYDLVNGEVYTLKWDNWESMAFLEIGESISLPTNLHRTKNNNLFVQKVLNNFNKSNSNTTGVMLSGLKGSGKTVMAKMIATDSNLPIIIVDPTFPTRYLERFFSKFKETKICVMFDEIDKNEQYWNTEHLLGFLDGIRSTSKKLVLFTCNQDSKMNGFVIDRCSRIRYHKKFDALKEDDVRIIVENNLIYKEKVEELITFIMNTFKVISYDNVTSFVDEVNEYRDEEYIKLVEDLNISTK